MLTQSIIEEFLKSGALFESNRGSFFLAWGASVSASQPSEQLFSLFVPSFFLQDPTPWRVWEKHLELNREDLVLGLNSYLSSMLKDQTVLLDVNWERPKKHEFEEVFQQVKKAINSGELQKIVPVVFQKTKWSLGSSDLPSMTSRASLLRNLLVSTAAYPSFVYGFWSASEGMLGATPEILFEVASDGSIETVALAGTRARTFGRETESLLSDAKELQEHQFVIDGIVQAIAPLANVEVGKTHEVVLPALIHLKTPIRAKWKNDPLNFGEVVKLLHPTPALGAFPKNHGWKWFKEFESRFLRKRFGAPIGIRVKDQIRRCLVAIRNLQWDDEELVLGAGCGLIQASQLEKEWKELQMKMSSVESMFGIGNSL